MSGNMTLREPAFKAILSASVNADIEVNTWTGLEGNIRFQFCFCKERLWYLHPPVNTCLPLLT